MEILVKIESGHKPKSTYILPKTLARYLRHHSIEIHEKDFLKLDYSFRANDCPLAEPCVNWFI